MDNTSAANADKASAASLWSPSKLVAGLMGREAPVVAATAPTEATADDVNGVDPATSISAAASATAAAAAATTIAPRCDWAADNLCVMIGLAPIKCQGLGCRRYAHHVCSNEWVASNNLPEEGIATYCRGHHQQYQRAKITPSSARGRPTISVPYRSAFGGPTHTSPVATADTAAAATATATATSPDAAIPTMDVSTVTKSSRGRSPITSTANKVNDITTSRKKTNKKGDLVDAVVKETRIGKGVRIFSERSKLITMVKQGDPQYDCINNAARAGFRFYGTVVAGNKRKGYWEVEYDLFPAEGRTLVITRRQCSTLRDGDDEPIFDPKYDKVNDATERLELLESEPEEDFDLALPESSDDEDNNGMGDGSTKPKARKKKRKTRKVLGIESFLAMDDVAVNNATTFHHFYGEGNDDYIEWTILKEGEEITTDIMQHRPQDASPFAKHIEWHPQTMRVDYFDIFFTHFFPSLAGKAAVLDDYLSNPQCAGHLTYWVCDKVRFHRSDHPDPDYIVSCCYSDCLLFVLICN